MTTRRFAFHHTWLLPAPPERVVEALADIEGYPRWWPQVRSVEQIDAVSGRGRIRSLLPITLRMVLTREIEDREGGHLRVALDGDLTGWAGWTVEESAGGSVATLAPFVLQANHAWMMRQGRRGLAKDLLSRR